MNQQGLHRGLELRLEALASRIAALRQKTNTVAGTEKIEMLGEIDELQRRYEQMVERLRALDREGAGFRQDTKAELEKIADDLSGSVDDFITWVDSGSQGSRPTIRGTKR